MKKIYSLFPCLIVLTLSITSIHAQCSAGYTFVVNPSNNGEVTFTNTSSTGTSGGPVYYSWQSSPSDFSSGSTNPVHVFNGVGTYYVCLTVYDSTSLVDSALGCTSTFCDSVFVINDSATCSAGFFHDTGPFPTVYLSNYSSGTISNYLWDFGDGTTSTLASPGPHTYASPGIYNICLTTTNPATQCNSTFCDTTFFSTCRANFTIVPDASGTGCTFNWTGPGTPDTYLWTFGDGTTSSVANPHHIYPTNSVYSTSLTVSSSTDSACWDHNWEDVTIGNCYAYYYVTQDSSNLYNYFTTTNSYSTTSGSTLTYLWDFGDGTSSTLMTPPHVYPGVGPYNLCLTIDDGMGCTSYYCDSIYPGHSTGSVLSLNMTSMGIQQMAMVNSFITYPNPFNTATTISYSLTQSSNVELSVFDLLGNKLAVIENGNKTAGEQKLNWNADNIASGVYLLELKTNNSKFVKKIVVEK